MATRVISQVRGVFQVEMPVRSLFETPTIAGLAESIEAARWKLDTAFVAPLRPVLREGNLPLSFAQQRLWFLGRIGTGKRLLQPALCAAAARAIGFGRLVAEPQGDRAAA